MSLSKTQLHNSAEIEVSKTAKESITFDFKKAIKGKIREDIQPFLEEKGFVSLPSDTYMREKNGLLQTIYFHIRKTELRTWSYFVPVYLPWKGVVNWGTCDSQVDASLRVNNPYAGYDPVLCAGHKDMAERDYQERSLPRFHALVSSIKNVILSEMELVSSAIKFAELLETGGLIWGRKAHPNQAMVDIAKQSGVRRIKILQSAAGEYIPKPLLGIITSASPDTMDDREADKWFHDYCNCVRVKFKLPKVNGEENFSPPEDN